MNYENDYKIIVFSDPITGKTVSLECSSFMNISIEEYIKLRVPDNVSYTIIDTRSRPQTDNLVENTSLNMFYKYLNAL